MVRVSGTMFAGSSIVSTVGSLVTVASRPAAANVATGSGAKLRLLSNEDKEFYEGLEKEDGPMLK